MRTTRSQIAELGGLSASIIAAIIGVFVIVATQVAYSGWASNITSQLHSLDSGGWPVDVTRDRGADPTPAAQDGAGATSPAAGLSAADAPGGSRPVTLGRPAVSAAGTGVQHATGTGGLVSVATSAGHAHPSVPAQPSVPSAPSVTQQVGGTGGGDQQLNPGRGPQSNGPAKEPAAPSTDVPETPPVKSAPQGQGLDLGLPNRVRGRDDRPPGPPEAPDPAAAPQPPAAPKPPAAP